jgi:hypothetical protein
LKEGWRKHIDVTILIHDVVKEIAFELESVFSRDSAASAYRNTPEGDNLREGYIAAQECLKILDLLIKTDGEDATSTPLQNISANFAAAQAETDRIHNENLHDYRPDKFVPGFTDKTLICHIITDSIVPVEQQQMLKSAVETEMRLRAEKGEKFQERVVCLSGKNMRDPNEFIEDLQAKIAEKLKEYQALGYTDIRFDVACPDIEYDDKTTLIGRVLDRGMEIKSNDNKTRVLKGLAFKPTIEGVDTVTQVEGIIMALRALDTENVDKLKAAFVSLAHRPLSKDELMINDLDTFIRRIPFILPATKMEDLNERKRINDLIATNIKEAA